MGAELVGTFTAFECHITVFPESFRVCEYTDFPYEPYYYGNGKERKCVKTFNCYKRRKHHKMVPVENTAGCATFVAHYKPEWTPDKNTYQVAHIKAYGYKDNNTIINYPLVVKENNQ